MSYITITDQEVAPGNLGSTSLFQKLRDNPDAARNANRKLIKFTAAGTFNYQKPSGLKRAVFELVGGGGGGSQSNNENTLRPGGGGGAMVQIAIEASDLPDNAQIEIGDGGYYSPFSDGGDTSINIPSIGLIVAGGGKTISLSSGSTDGGVPNQIALDNADVCQRGESGEKETLARSGRGGDSYLSLGGGVNTSGGPGKDGGIGGGGGGGTNVSSTAQAGGRGGAGAVYITEVY